MNLESYENISEYHVLFTDSQRKAIELMASGNKKEARNIVIFLIRYVFTLYKSDEDLNLDEIKKEVIKLDLDNLEFDDLIITMVYYQGKIGLRPVQEYRAEATTFNKIRDRLYG